MRSNDFSLDWVLRDSQNFLPNQTRFPGSYMPNLIGRDFQAVSYAKSHRERLSGSVQSNTALIMSENTDNTFTQTRQWQLTPPLK